MRERMTIQLFKIWYL